ncbi:MAG: 7-carboxy-7-deazaguanine synthase [Robiginitomaculum sp.]
MSIYSVKEMFLSVQGEGAHTGRPCVFLRFAGCNLWSGREKDRAGAVCKFCDTKFVGVDGLGGGQYNTAEVLAKEVSTYWPNNGGEKWVTCTGGEPLLQLDDTLVKALHNEGFKIAVETNGTLAAPAHIDWLCVSPKADAALVQAQGDELKLVYPQAENSPEDFKRLEFKVFSLQPLDNKSGAHEAVTFQYCIANPQWRLSLQTHKYLGVR